ALAQKNNLKDVAQSAENKINEILDKVPSVFSLESENRFEIGNYYLKSGNFTDTTANEYRGMIAEEITKLIYLLNKNN
ncbi:MAG: hypothetical protein PHV82_12665, partial [Victivallaceae bacterium]|nr:hypothetical protein [Victivallaceae bacterium]